MGEEFHGVIKLITGEEIFAMISIDENDGDPVIMLQSPVIMKVYQNPTGQYVKVRPWLELPNEDIFSVSYTHLPSPPDVEESRMPSSA